MAEDDVETAQPTELRRPRFMEATKVVSPIEPTGDNAVEAPPSKSRRTAKREETPKQETHFWRNVSWQFTLFAKWRGWPVIREYLPLTSGLVAWLLMGVLAATGPLTDVWFVVASEQKLGATGYCDGR